MIKRAFSMGVLCLSMAAAPAPSVAESASARDMGLADLVEAALQRQPANVTPPPFQSSSWLAALPSLGLSYLRSDEHLGTDETELSLNLPLKSPRLHQQERLLRSLKNSLAEAESDRRRLYFSGLIRESSWSWRIAAARVDYAGRKIALLQQLLERQQALFKVQSSNRYSLLLIRQELSDARIRQMELQLQADTWANSHRQLTGQGYLPESLDEAPPPAGDAWHSHPEMRLLDLGWQQQQAQIIANSASAASWDLAVQAKQLDNREFSEKQYGLAVEIPLSAFDVAAQSDSNAWRQASADYWQQRDELQLQLARSARKLQSTASYLERRQALLEESASTSGELLEESRYLLGQNELAREFWIRRLLNDLDKQAEAAINQLQIGQNLAMSRQAAGIPL